MSGTARSTDDLSTLLEDGIRYDRSGVSARARACYAEITERAGEDPVIAAEAWWRLANLQRLHSEWDDAVASAHASAELARTHGLTDVEADACNVEGAIWTTRGEASRAQRLFERTIALTSRPLTRANALQNLGTLAAEEGRYDEAFRLFTESREAYRVADDTRGEACSLLNLGRLHAVRGAPGPARDSLESAVKHARISGDLELHAAALLNLGYALGELGEMAEAEERITTAYGQFTIADIPVQRVRCLQHLATLAMRRGEVGAAQICLEHAHKVATRAELPRELRQIDEQRAQLPS